MTDPAKRKGTNIDERGFHGFGRSAGVCDHPWQAKYSEVPGRAFCAFDSCSAKNSASFACFSDSAGAHPTGFWRFLPFSQAN